MSRDDLYQQVALGGILHRALLDPNGASYVFLGDDYLTLDLQVYLTPQEVAWVKSVLEVDDVESSND